MSVAINLLAPRRRLHECGSSRRSRTRLAVLALRHWRPAARIAPAAPRTAVSPEHAAAVGATVHPLVTVANPLDYHTFSWGDEAALAGTFTAFARAGFDATLLVLDFPRPDRCEDADWWVAADAFERAMEAAGAPRGEPVGGDGGETGGSARERKCGRGAPFPRALPATDPRKPAVGCRRLRTAPEPRAGGVGEEAPPAVGFGPRASPAGARFADQWPIIQGRPA